MQFTKIDLKPGIFREHTDYANSGGWWDCDMVRFRKGKPEKMGGWQKLSTTSMIGNCRSLFRFRDLNGTIYTACGTSKRVYLERGGELFDITPLRRTAASLANPLSTVSGSDQVEVDDTGHGTVVGATIIVSGASAIGGIAAGDLNGERTVSEVVDANSYKFTAGAAASSTVNNGGGTVTIEYLVNPGLDVVIGGSGWGTDTWGSDEWGLPSTTPTGTSVFRVWHFDNFGEDLIFSATDFNLYIWDASDGVNVRATLLSDELGALNVPDFTRKVIVSDRDRHVVSFGATPFGDTVQDPLMIRWSDRENAIDWTPTTTTSAGELRVGSGSFIVTAVETRQEMVVFTDSSVHLLRYVGGAAIFGIDKVAGNTTIMGVNSAVPIGDGVFWMGRDSFYVYTGSVLPLPCDVEDYVFGDINLLQGDKVYAGSNASEGEVIWFYPSASSSEIDRYVIYNYVQNIWYFGSLSRYVWLDRVMSEYPIAAGADGFLYYHEIGCDDGSTNPPSAISAHCESSPIEIGEGYNFMFIERIIPDITYRGAVNGSVANIVLSSSSEPGGSDLDTSTSAITKTQTVPVEEFTEEAWVRLRGRSFRFRVESTGAGVDWRLGTPRISYRQDGRR